MSKILTTDDQIQQITRLEERVSRLERAPLAPFNTGIIPAGSITGAMIGPATITGTNIAAATIGGSNIQLATITGDNIGTGIITSDHIQNASILGGDIALATIHGTNIDTGTITGTNIANATIGGTNIANATISGTNIGTAAIASTHIQDGSITGLDIGSATITGGNIGNLTITATQIADNTVTASKITDLTITSAEIADLTITGAKIAAATITANKITVTNLSALSADLGSITAGTITGVTITGATFQTSASNPRVYMDSSGVGAVDAGGVTNFKLDASTGKITTLAGIGGGNLYQDASFENPDNATIGLWINGNGTWARSTAQVKHGLYSIAATKTVSTGTLEVIAEGSPTSNAIIGIGNHAAKVTGGKTYTLSAWVRASTSRQVYITSRFTKSNGDLTSSWNAITSDPITAVNTEWRRVVKTAVAPSDAVSTGFTVVGNSMANGDVLYFDGIQIEEGEIATAFAPKPDEIYPSQVPPVGGFNLIRNSSFEYQPDIGTKITGFLNTIVGDTTEKHQGMYSIKATATSAGSTQIINDSAAHRFPVIPGEKITYSVYVKPTVTSTIGIGPRTFNSAGTYITQRYDNPTSCPANVWTRITFTDTVQSGEAFFGWVVTNFTAAIGNIWYIDAVQAERGQVITAYTPKADEVLPGNLPTLGTVNLLRDSSFEGGINTPNMINGTADISSAFAHTGTKSVRMICNGAGTGWTWIGNLGTTELTLANLGLKVGDEITGSAYVRASSGGTLRSVQMIMEMFNAGGTDSGSIYGTAVAEIANEWVRITVSGVIPANTTRINPVINIQGPPANTEVHYADDWQIELGGVATAYGPKIDEILPNQTGVLGGNNLVPNSSFEQSTLDGIPGWTLYNNNLSPAAALAAVSFSAGSKHGFKAARIINGTDTSGEAGIVRAGDMRIPVEGNKVYTWSYYCQPSGAGPFNYGGHIHWYDSGGSIIGGGSSMNTVAGVGNVWTRNYITAQAPSNAVRAAPYAWVVNPESTGGHNFDATQFEEGYLTAYAPKADEIMPGAVGGSNKLANARFDYWPASSGDSPWMWNHYDNGGTGGPFTWSKVANGGPTGTENSWRLQATNRTQAKGFQSQPQTPLKQNTDYVHSFWWKGNQPPEWVSNYNPADSEWLLRPGVQTGLWQRYAIRIRTPDATALGVIGGDDYFYVWCAATSFDVQIALPQWEEANAVTDWGAKPDEVLPQSITGGNSATSNIVSGSIVAGDIATNTITANQIAAEAIATSELAANAVSTDKLAAGSITASKIAVGGISDNLIVNWSAEGNSIDGWKFMEIGAGSPTFSSVTSSTSPHGDCRFEITAGSSGWGYRAIPVVPGTKYALRVKLLHGNGNGNYYVRMNESTNYPPGDFVDAGQRTSYTDLAASLPNSTITAWTNKEYVYTVPAGINWVSPSIYNYPSTGILAFDAIEMREQISGALIVDGAIDAKTITGAVIRTSASGARVELNSTELAKYASDGVTKTVRITPANGLELLASTQDSPPAEQRIQWKNASSQLIGEVYANDWDFGGGVLWQELQLRSYNKNDPTNSLTSMRLRNRNDINYSDITATALTPLSDTTNQDWQSTIASTNFVASFPKLHSLGQTQRRDIRMASGQSVITGNGTTIASLTIDHGLGITPHYVICSCRNSTMNAGSDSYTSTQFTGWIKNIDGNTFSNGQDYFWIAFYHGGI